MMCPARDNLRRQRANAGFTLVETLVTTLVVLMVSVIIATGVPSAINAYRNTVAASNAQVALSTLTSALRDELGAATSAKPASGAAPTATFEVAKYCCGEGYFAKIENAASEGNRGPVKTADDARLSEGNGNSWSLVPNAQLSASATDLYASFDSITFDPSSRVFEVAGLRVYEDDNGSARDLATIETEGNVLVIRAPYCEAEAA